MQTTRLVRLEAVRTIHDLRDGKLDPGAANATFNGLKVVLQCLECSEEKRIAELESVVRLAVQAAREENP